MYRQLIRMPIKAIYQPENKRCKYVKRGKATSDMNSTKRAMIKINLQEDKMMLLKPRAVRSEIIYSNNK